MNCLCQAFRQKVVASILRIQENHQQISRNSIFLAISIFDLFLLKSVDSWNAQPISIEAYAISCLLIAWKYQGDKHPHISSIHQKLKISMELQKFKGEVIELEQIILLKIDFEIPTVTAYDSLDSVIDASQLKNDETRRDVARSIKIILTAVRITYELSFDPTLGAQIHQITKKVQSVDGKARSIYRKCLKVIQNQQNNQKTVVFSAQ